MIHIITPCHRPGNLDTIKKSMPEDCNWIIVYDKLMEDHPDLDGAVILRSGRTGGYGGPNISYALETYPFEDEDWLAFMDSDNIVHPEWLEAVKPHLDKDFAMITWGQFVKNGEKRLYPVTIPQIGNIDNASYMVKWKYAKGLTRTENYVQDGEYAIEVANRGRVLALNKYIAYYNYIE
jgi:hypothetical protein